MIQELLFIASVNHLGINSKCASLVIWIAGKRATTSLQCWKMESNSSTVSGILNRIESRHKFHTYYRTIACHVTSYGKERNRFRAKLSMHVPWKSVTRNIGPLDNPQTTDPYCPWYRRTCEEGLVHSSLMQSHRHEKSWYTVAKERTMMLQQFKMFTLQLPNTRKDTT